MHTCVEFRRITKEYYSKRDSLNDGKRKVKAEEMNPRRSVVIVGLL